MLTETSAELRTDSSLVIAHAKLPDDLLLEEFNDLTRALQTIDEVAGEQARRDIEPYRGHLPEPSPAEVLRVQYGSDFITVLGVGGTVVGLGGAILTSAAGAFLVVAKCLDVLASAGLKNEERLRKREKRLARRAERKSAEHTIATSVPFEGPDGERDQVRGGHARGPQFDPSQQAAE